MSENEREMTRIELVAEIERLRDELAAYKAAVAYHNESETKDEPHCTCHERDGSYCCDYCHSQGFYGHMEYGGTTTESEVQDE